MNRTLLMALFGLCFSWGTFNLGRAVGGPKFGLDFTQYYVASRLILEGKGNEIYGSNSSYHARAAAYGAVTEAGESMTNAYPPFAAFLLLPFALLPFRFSLVLFTILGLVASAVGVRLFFADEDQISRGSLTLAGLLVTFSFFPVYYSIYMGQMNALLFLLAAMALHAARRDRAWPCGLFIALATLLKIFPAVLIAYFAVKRKPRIVVATLVSIVVLTVMSFTVCDASLYRTYFTTVLPHQTQGGAFYRNQGLGGALARLMTNNAYVHAATNQPILAHWLGFCGGALLLIGALFVAARVESTSAMSDMGFGLVWVATLLALPTCWEHYAGMLLFGYLAFLRRALKDHTPRSVPIFLASFSYCVWTFLLTAGTDYEWLPRSVWFQPVFSAKFLAAGVLYFACMSMLRLAAREEPLPRAV
jgi:hypothetical protein